MDARAATDVCGSSVRRSRVVLTPRCWRQAGGRYPAGDGGKRAVHRGERAISRKAIAQGRPECSRCPVCSCAFLFAQIARETAGAASTRSSLRPLFRRGQEVAGKPRTQCAARSRHYIHRHCERSEAIHSAAGGEMDCFAALAMTAKKSRSPDERSENRDHSNTAPDIAECHVGTVTPVV